MTATVFRLTNPELEAEIYYLTETEGGRYSDIFSGYRGQFHYNGKDWNAPQEFVNNEKCSPGDSVQVRLQTTSPCFHAGQFYAGQRFEVREGARTVGRGTITKVLRPDFRYWDFGTFFESLPVGYMPYSFKKANGFITELNETLRGTRQTDSLKTIRSLSDKNQMFVIECDLKNSETGSIQRVGEICNSLQNKIQSVNSLYKVNSTHSNAGTTFELPFAVWDKAFLTGKVIINAVQR